MGRGGGGKAPKPHPHTLTSSNAFGNCCKEDGEVSIVGILHAHAQTGQRFSFRRIQSKAGESNTNTDVQLQSSRETVQDGTDTTTDGAAAQLQSSRREGGQAAHQHHSTLTPKSRRRATTHADANATRERSDFSLPRPTCSRSRPNCGESAVGSRCTSPAIALTTPWWYGISPAWQAEGENMLVGAGGVHGHLCVSTFFLCVFTQLCC
jgi:hypothetical protein